MTISTLRKSNVAKFLPIVSNDEVIRELLSPGNDQDQTAADLTFAIFSNKNFVNLFNTLKLSTINENERLKSQDALKKLNEAVSSILVTTFHSLTINISFTNDILNFISKETYESIKNAFKDKDPNDLIELHGIIMDQIGEYVKFIHEDYNVKYPNNTNKLLSDTNFVIKKNIPIKDGKTKNFKHNNTFGLLGFNSKKIKKSKKYSLGLNPDVRGVITGDKNKLTLAASGRETIFNAREIVDYKMKQSQKSTSTANEDDGDLESFLNFVDANKDLKINEDTSSISYILMNNPKMRAGTKNSLELSTFFGSLSTIELSKCLPYLDVKFILPGEVKTKGANIFKTASLTQFLDGTNISVFNTSDNYRVLEASFVRDAGIEGGGNTRKQNAVETNLSVFTMPQTINNFDEQNVGHLESFSKELKGNEDNNLFERNNSVHDYTKPFLTIKSFNIDVAPTQGLMSFKTGKLSLVLHDKTRMADIAPFIKPDLFGSFGAEIAIKYGWSHMDAINENTSSQQKKDQNYFAKFLNEKKVYEKYIITNSSYSIDANGQVNIDLAIAMKGPVSLRAINFETEKPKKINSDLLNYRKKRVEKSRDALKKTSLTINSGSNLFTDAIVGEFKSNLDVNSKKKLNKITKADRTLGKFRSKIRKAKNSKGASLEKWIPLVDGFFRKLEPQEIWITRGTKRLSVEGKGAVYNAEIALTPAEANSIWSLYVAIVYLITSAKSAIESKRGEQTKKIEGLLQKLTEGLSLEDAFFDNENYADVESITSDTLFNKNMNHKGYFTSITGLDSNDANKKELTPYVSLGNIILAIIGSHLSFSRGYDEIQVVSYTLNDHAGAASNKNISSLIVEKNELNKFLGDLFKNGAQYTLESLLTQIVKKFFTTRYCFNYGLRDLYRINENGNVEPNTESKKPNEFEKVVNERLQLIHKRKFGKSSKENNIADITFVMPKIKLSFDTMTTDNSGGVDTILRVSVFDQNDNPFTSVTSIMNKIFDSDVQNAISDINKRRISLKAEQNNSRNYSKIKREFINENARVVESLVKKGFLKEVNNQLVINTSSSYAFDSIKERLKGFMPSLTYGTHNSAIIDASISTINEAKLNTVYLTRPGRNDTTLKTKVRYQQDLPLRILPSQVSMTIFGCPFVNFAQYLFLDFETNTTIDNQYAVTGIKHEITPGKFTTQLTLAYGDAYGKYENIVDTLSRTAQEIEQGQLDLQSEDDKDSNQIIVQDSGTTKNNKSLIEIKNKTINLDDITGSIRSYKNFIFKNEELLFNIDIKSIRIINYKEKDSVFYNISVNRLDLVETQNPDDIEIVEIVEPQINFDELIISVSEASKFKDKYYLIDIMKKAVKPGFEFNSQILSDYLTFLLVKTNEASFKKPNANYGKWKNNKKNDYKFYKELAETQSTLFSILLKIYIFPFIQILVGRISKKDDIRSIEFFEKTPGPMQNDIRTIYYEDLNTELKKEILDKNKHDIIRSIDKSQKYKKHIAGVTRDCQIKDIKFQKNKILLVIEYVLPTKKGKKNKLTTINISDMLNMKKSFLTNLDGEGKDLDIAEKLSENFIYDN
jgi:hypothetical protein